MKTPTRITLLLLRWSFASAFLVLSGYSLGAEEPRQPLPAEQVQQLRTFAEVYRAVKDGFVDEVDDKKLMGACLSGMLSGIDADSAYLDSDALAELSSSPGVAGIGLEIGMEDGLVKVVAPIEGTPAAGSGIRSGDLIIRIDDVPTKGLGLTQAVKYLRGKPDSLVTLTIIRSGETKPLAYTIKREVLKVSSVKTSILSPGYALIRIAQLQEQTGITVVRHLQELYREIQLKGLVLDLRNNPGGLFNVSVGIAAVFLPKNSLVVSTSGRIADSKRNYLASFEDYSRSGSDYQADLPAAVKKVPMIVLINAGSAAGSEIIAGALQSHKRAIIMGTRSFGRGTIQTVLPLPNKTAIKLTTARWYMPNGQSVQSKGILPDIVVSESQGESSSPTSGKDFQISKAHSLLKDFWRD